WPRSRRTRSSASTATGGNRRSAATRGGSWTSPPTCTSGCCAGRPRRGWLRSRRGPALSQRAVAEVEDAVSDPALVEEFEAGAHAPRQPGLPAADQKRPDE